MSLLSASSLFFILCLYFASSQFLSVLADNHQHDHHGEEHSSGDFSFEWHGLTEMKASDSLWWNAGKVKGEYAAPSMVMVLIPLSSQQIGSSSLSSVSQSSLKEVLEEAEHTAMEIIEENNNGTSCINTTTIDITTPSNTSCYCLLFNSNHFLSTFQINAPNSNADIVALATFTQHVPTEFENGVHFLINRAGNQKAFIIDSAAAATPSSSSSRSSRSSQVRNTMLASLACVAIIVVLAPVAVLVQKYSSVLIRSVTLAFSSGAIFATAIFMTALEAAHLIESKYSNESSVSALWGVMLIAGFLCNPFAEILLNFAGIDIHGHGEGGHSHGHGKTESNAALTTELDDVEKAQSANSIELASKQNSSNESISKNAVHDESVNDSRPREEVNWRLVRSVVIGDFLHNFVDGIFIGAAFSKCSSGLAWTITGATIGHEIAQEIGDFILLTAVAKLRPHWALLINFVAALSVMLGAAAILADSSISNYDVGMCLAFACGVYIYTSLIEGAGWLNEKSPTIRLVSLTSFIIGSTAIGLVLLNHDHCDANEGAATGAGGGHSH